MKIVFIIDQVFRHGGIERVLSIKANNLANQGHSIYILTTEQGLKKPCYSFNPNICFKDLGINYKRSKSYFHPINLLKLPKHVFKTQRTLKNVNPDVVVVCSHSVDTFFVPFINRAIPKVKEFHFSKAIEAVHRQKSSKSKKAYFLKFADFVESKYDKLVVLNPDEANYYKSPNVAIIPNPLTFYPDKISNADNPIVISAGRMAHVKRFDVLIDIWKLVHHKNKNWQLHIYGEGDPEYIKMLHNKIKDAELTNQIILKGATDQIQNKMLHSSLFVMTSDNECFPLVLLEAQACGLPIVSFDCPHGPRNIINNTNGVLVQPGNHKEFAESILELMANADLRKTLGTSARENANKYQVQAIMTQWLQMFNELIITKK